MIMQNLIEIHPFDHKILNQNKILTITKVYGCVVNMRRLTRNGPNLGLVKVIAYAKFDQIPLILSQDIEWKLNFDNNDRPVAG